MAKPKRSKTMTTFGKNLRAARKEKYPSAEKFAEMMGIHPHTYRKYERGDTQPPLETLRRICTALEVPVGILLPTEPKAPERAA
jgi:transcriptional regulator with XRE-family HTH domain